MGAAPGLCRARRRRAGVVIAAAQLDRFQSVVESLDLPEKTITLFVKAEGTVIYLSHDPERHIGQSRRGDALTRSLLEGRSGVTSGVSVDGVARIYGFHPAAGTDWLAVVGIDVAPIRVGVRASAVRQGLYGPGVRPGRGRAWLWRGPARARSPRWRCR
ncbi:MAG: hypothetical protein FJY34_01370 [Betaproteobacteria bacterium]|nr:hypothetical protein [Betaproteobacteria bacterium]